MGTDRGLFASSTGWTQTRTAGAVREGGGGMGRWCDSQRRLWDGRWKWTPQVGLERHKKKQALNFKILP